MRYLASAFNFYGKAVAKKSSLGYFTRTLMNFFHKYPLRILTLEAV